MEHKGCCHGQKKEAHECKCDHNEEEMSTEYLVENNNLLLNTLIDLLIEKGVFSETELRKKLDDLGMEELEEELEELEKTE